MGYRTQLLPISPKDQNPRGGWNFPAGWSFSAEASRAGVADGRESWMSSELGEVQAVSGWQEAPSKDLSALR